MKRLSQRTGCHYRSRPNKPVDTDRKQVYVLIIETQGDTKMIMNNEKIERYYEIYRARRAEFYSEAVAWIDSRELPSGDAVAMAMLSNCEKRLVAAVNSQMESEYS